MISLIMAMLAASRAWAEGMAPEFNPAVVQQLINDYRRSRGLNAVEIDAKLTAAAAAHSHDLARRDLISHRGSDGSDPWTRVKRTGYPARYSAENIGVGQKSMGELIAGWRRSPPHNANLLSESARQMGVAMVYRPGTRYKTYWTLVLGAQRAPGKLYKPRRQTKPGKIAKATKPAATLPSTPTATLTLSKQPDSTKKAP